MPRFQLAFLVTLLLQGLQSVAMPMNAAAVDEVRPRHSLIHRPPVESPGVLPTTQGTILQSPSAQPARITGPIGPSKTSATPATVPITHHRALTKRPAMASTTAPATSSQMLQAALTSGVAAGQATQPTANTKGTTPTATAPVMRATAAPLPRTPSTGSAMVPPNSTIPFAGAAGVRAAASARSGSAPSSSGSRSASNLLRNSAIANLLQPPAPVVAPPSLPPSSTSPSTPLPSPPSTSTGSATLTWTANSEPDVAGYKIYVGTASGIYSFPGSAFVTGKVTSYTVYNLPKGQTYFFAMSAYDNAGNESPLSAEISKSLF